MLFRSQPAVRSNYFVVVVENLLTIFYPSDIEILADIFVIKALQMLKSAQDDDGIWREWKAICTALAGRMSRRKERRNSYLCLIKSSHSL